MLTKPIQFLNKHRLCVQLLSNNSIAVDTIYTVYDFPFEEVCSKILIDPIQHKTLVILIFQIGSERLSFAGCAGKPFQYLAFHIQLVGACCKVEILICPPVSNKLSIVIDEAARKGVTLMTMQNQLKCIQK